MAYYQSGGYQNSGYQSQQYNTGGYYGYSQQPQQHQQGHYGGGAVRYPQMGGYHHQAPTYTPNQQKNASNPFVGSKQVSCCRICVIGAYSYLYDRGQLVIITRELATAKILTRTTYHRIKRTTLQDLRVAQLLATLTTTTLTPLHPTLLLLQLRATLCTGIPVIRLDNNSHHHNLKQLGFNLRNTPPLPQLMSLT